MSMKLMKQWGIPSALALNAVLLTLGFFGSPTTHSGLMPETPAFCERTVTVHGPGLTLAQFEAARLRLLALPGVLSVEFVQNRELRLRFDESRPNLVTGAILSPPLATEQVQCCGLEREGD